MPEFIGNIQVPEITPSGVFPLKPDYGYGRARAPQVMVHQFGSANAKIEQRFLLGNGAKRFTVRKAFLRETDRIALRDFWETQYGPYGAFTYNAPNDDGQGTTAFTCRFANEPLSWEFLTDSVSSLGITLIEIPASSPTYTLNQTVTRFPTQALKDALLSQVQEIIPLVKIQPRQAGYPAIYVSDRRCTIGGQLYQARLLEFGGIAQSLGNEADEARFTFGNADRVMRDLANDVDLFRASLEFSLFHVGTGIKLDLWKGNIVDWELDAGPEFRVRASDGIYELNLPYPTRKAGRFCWKDFNDGQNCPFSSQGSLDLTHFPSASSSSCDKGYDTDNGCLAHGMKRFFGGILAEPQSVSIKIRDPKIRITSTSILNESIAEQVLQEIYTDTAFPVPCMITAGREEGEFFNALGIVGEGPIGSYGAIVHRDETGAVTKVIRHTLDGQEHHGSPGPLGLREIKGTDPAGAQDFFALGQSGQAHPSDWRQASAGASNYKDNFAAGTAFLELKRHDPKGLQLSRPTDHEMIAIVAQGMGGWVWTAPGSRSFQSGITNPVWIVVNMLLRALGYRAGENLTSAQLDAAENLFDVNAAVAAANICDFQVSPVITREQWVPVTQWVEDQDTGALRPEIYYDKQQVTQETQFKFRGIIQDEKPLRDWIQEVLMNCLGYYSFAFGKLKLGIRVNSSVVEAFTEGNIVFQSLRLAPLKPSFNRLVANFADLESQFSGYSLPVEDIDHAKLIGGATSPLRLTSTMNLAGATTKSQAGRIIATRLREELGGINASEWKAAREIAFKTTVLALNTEPGMVCSMTHPDMPGGSGEFRVTGWQLNPDYSIDIQGRTTTDGMYNLAVGPKPADVVADPVPTEFIPTLPKLTDWELAADPDGQLRLSFTIPPEADYLTGQLRVLEEIELLRVQTTLAAPLAATDTTLQVASSVGFLVGEYVNIGQEILQIVGPGVLHAEPTSTTWQVARGQKLSEASAAANGESVYRLVEREFHFEYPPGYTFARAGLRQTERFKPGSVRILYASVRFFNFRGSSQIAELPFWATWESEFGAALFGSLPGLRVSTGGLATIQVPGPLATGEDLAPDLLLPAGLSIGIVSAKTRVAPTGQGINFRLDSVYSDGTIVQGGITGIPVDSTESGPIASGAKETVDTGNRAFRLVMLQVGSSNPGEDLTVLFTF